jgi:predicted DsbA family dithiol-disulfide isomerase
MSDTRVLTIDVVSDLVSPWCYLAMGRLERALSTLKGASVPVIRWQPFEINPAIPSAGMDVDRYLSAVFGSADIARQVLDEVTSEGEAEGIHFDFSRVRSVPNTLSAHRLILLAEEEDRGERMTQTLFQGFFEQGRDIGDLDVLAGLAEEVGLDADSAGEYLAGDRNRDTVRSREAQARSVGLVGVPSIIVNGHLAVMGVQGSDTILAAIDQALFHELSDTPGAGVVH